MDFKNIIVEKKGNVGLITLNRPKALNALCAALITELHQAIDDFEADDEIGALVVTGSEKAFAAGADIKEMQDKSWPAIFMENFITEDWERLAKCRKPVVAAVAGYALGGGCELAMMCDIIIAADNAVFGQPEVKLAIPPGAGGTQRLTRIIGKAKAMDMILTGRNMDAEEAERAGLVTRVVPVDGLLDDALKTAGKIASMSRPMTMMLKETVNRAYETTLAEGIRFERHVMYAAFGTKDQTEGMAAFAEKRKPDFTNE